eukprot:8241384-Pyramimonas_sp.AAC.1
MSTLSLNSGCWPQEVPRGPEMAPERPRRHMMASGRPQKAPTPQESPESTSRRAPGSNSRPNRFGKRVFFSMFAYCIFRPSKTKTAQEAPKIAPRRPKRAPRRPKKASGRPQEGSLRGDPNGPTPSITDHLSLTPPHSLPQGPCKGTQTKEEEENDLRRGRGEEEKEKGGRERGIRRRRRRRKGVM